MSDSELSRRERRAAADALLEAVEAQLVEMEALRAENRLGRAARLKMRERIEDTAGHEADTLFGSWLDSDDRVADRLERLLKLQQRTAEALRAHIALTEMLLYELEPERGDPRVDG